MNASRDFLVGTGEMAELIRSTDWSATPLGSPETWPQSLRSAVSILLPSKAQITLFWGPDLVTLYNDNYRPVLGKKHPRALGLPVRDVWIEIWETGLRDLFEGVMRTGDAFWAKDRLFFLERHGYAEETFFDVSYDPVRDESGSVGGVFCIVSETTGRVLGERRLRALRDLAARNANARSLDEACSLSITAMGENAHDLTFVLLYLAGPDEGPPGFQCSTQGAATLGEPSRWPLAEAMRTNEILVVALDESFGDLPKGAWQRRPAQAAVVPVAASGASARAGALVVGLNPFRPFDDEYRGFLELLSRQVAGALGSAQAYEHERKRAEALAALDHAKTTFFSNVSHEFRTPLTLLLGPIRDLVERSSGITPDERAMLGVAQRNGQRMLKLVNTLLDFSRIEAGRSQASYEPTELATFTTDLASSFRSAVEKAGLRLVVDCPPLPEPAFVDRDMWEKIVLNLLSNALKFTFEGEIVVELRQIESTIELSVRDTGTGIPPREMPHLFERFWRIEGARSRTHEGTGIGLALVQELARLHGGAVRADSVEGKGSDFRVTFPAGKAHLPEERIGSPSTPIPKATGADPYVEEALRWLPDAEPTAAELEPALPRAGGTARRRRIVLADDNADMRDYVRRLLSPLYEVRAVSNGTLALEAVHANPTDLVLADVMMPELDGLALARSLRADAKTAGIPIVLLSARAGEESRIEGLEAGADEYLYKPFSARELLARIESRLELAQLQSRLEQDRERSLREEALTLSALNRVGKAVAGELDLDLIMQTVTDAATQLSGAEFGAYFHNVTNEAGDSYLLYTLSGAPREAFAKFGTPRNTAIFAPTFAGQGVVRLDDVTLDPRYGKNVPHQGMPKGHLPVKSYLAVPVTSRSGRVMGGLFFGHSRPGVFSERSEVLVTGIASQTAVAVENAELHKQREQLIDKLRDADRRKDEFLATLSHELRNPLAPLRNSLHLLLMSGSGGEPTEPLREMMERQVNHLVRLVDDLLEMSRISRGAFELRNEPVELAAIVKNAVETSEPLLTGAHHELSVTLPQESIWLDGDPVRLAQILSNLLNNAAKYTEPGGEIQIEATRNEGMVQVVVRDNGIGISPATLERIFDMFSRGDRSNTRSQTGLGIGLALARRLAEMHGGTLDARSAGPGAGSEFRVRLPISAHAPQKGEVESRSQSKVSQAKRILVVDDNHDAAETLGALLGFLGADVRLAPDGPKALGVFAEYDPTLVFLDIGMPGMDGYEVANRIRKSFPERHPVLVALTGWGQAEDRRRAREAGFDHHLVKPAELAALQTLLALRAPD
jgi:signal transduction histidine kinase/DNA-binding response OmpR family regulator